MSDTHPHTIGDVARVLRMTHRTLRFYESRGLIAPLRTKGLDRFYSDAHLDRLRRLKQLTGYGFTLIESAQMMGWEKDKLIAAFDQRHLDLIKEVERITEIRIALNAEIAQLKKGS